jgi:PGF-CTERM protein
MKLKKVILIFAVMLTVLVLGGTGYARASPPAEEWNRTCELSGITSVNSFQQTADAGYILTLSPRGKYNARGNSQYYFFDHINLLKIGPTGSEQWNRTLDGTFSDNRAISVLETSDGGYLIAGSIGDCDNRNCTDDVWLTKMNAQGQEQWNLTLGGADNEEMVFVQQTADGGYILIGNTDSHGAGSSDIWFEKVDSNGNMQWNNTFGGIGRDMVRIVRQVPGGYIIAGNTESYGAGDSDFWLVKTDTNGEEQWNNTYGGYYGDGVYSLQQTHDHGYIIAGMTNSFGASHNDFLLVKTDSNGTEQWYRTFGGVSHELFPIVRLSPDGGYILGGITLSFDDYWLIKTDEDGNVQWDRTFEGSGLDSFQQTPDGGYIIKGDFYDPYKTWLVKKTLIKTDSNGNEQWDIRIEGDELDSVLQTENGGYILAGTKDSKLLLVKLMAERPTPLAQFTYDLGYPGANKTISFDASVSHDPYRNITYYQWDMGDGSYVNTTQRTVTHSYDEGGNYSVNLTVTSNNGDMSSITREITVQQSEPPIMRWNKTFGGDGDDRVYSLMHTSDGGYILAGYSYYIDERHFDARLVKTDANGNMQWQRNIKGNDSIEAHSAMQTSDDGYIIAGSTGIYYGIYDFWLVKIDAEGTEQWNRTFEKGTFSSDRVKSVLETSDGGYLIAGSSSACNNWTCPDDVWLVKTDAEGTEQWNRTFGGDSSDQLYSLQQTFDGGYILGGDTRSFGTGSSDFWLVKIDNNGIELWNRTFGGANHESAHSVQQTSDGGFIMAGVTGSTYSYDCWLVKTDTEGVEMWNRKIVRPNYYNSPYSILQSPDGGYIIAGKTGSAGTEYYSDMWLASIDSDGYVQWEMTFGGTGPNVAARAVLLAPDGGLIVAGEKGLHTENDSDFWLAKFGGIPAEPEGGNAPTNSEPVPTPDMPGFGAAVAVMGLLVWVYLAGRRL